MSDQPTTPGRGARIAIAIGRILFGLVFLMAGTVNLLMVLKVMPEQNEGLPPGALEFATALQHTGYMMGLIALTQLVVGLLLVVNRCVPLALALITPFMVNSVCFHAFLEHGGLVPALVISTLLLALAWAYRGSFAPMLAPRARPGDRWTRAGG
jgi:uncharacterized membrane protein YphA (DoxX/SURF4 family)